MITLFGVKNNTNKRTMYPSTNSPQTSSCNSSFFHAMLKEMKKGKKKTTLKSTKKVSSPKSIGYFLKRYFFSLFILSLVFLGVHFSTALQKPTFCANSISCIKDLSTHVENNAIGVFNNHAIGVPAINLAIDTATRVLGAKTVIGEKHIYVDLSRQELFAMQGSTLFMHTLISSGKWHPTPTGDFTIWVKIRATRMTGGSGDDFYDLPNVPYVMFFSNDQVPASEGFSLHGAYWHNNFGHPMSHGCVNMRPDDAHKLYDWADPATTGYTTYADDKNLGTKVSICTSITTDQENGKITCVE